MRQVTQALLSFTQGVISLDLGRRHIKEVATPNRVVTLLLQIYQEYRMNLRTIATTLSLSTGLLVTGAVAFAQHDQHDSGAGQAPAVSHQMMSGKMPQMMSAHREISALADQLLKGFAVIETEKDPVVLQKKLAEHGVLLKELAAKIQAQSQAMEKMHGQMMTDHMMGGDKKKP